MSDFPTPVEIFGAKGLLLCVLCCPGVLYNPGMANTERRQEPYWAWACQTCKRQLRDSTSQCCGDYGKTIYLVPEDLHRLALGMAADDAERFTPQQYIEMAQRKLDLLGAQA